MLRAVAALAAAASLSAEARPAARPDPSDSRAEAPAVGYDSTFMGYRKFEDSPPASWRDANDLAYRLGGWKAFASGKVPGDIEPPAADADGAKSNQPPAPASSGHADHKTR